MSLKDGLIQSAVNKVRSIASGIGQNISNSFNDNQGLFQQGKFTPGKAVQQQVNYQMQTSPVNRALYTAIGTAGRPIVNSLANIGALGATGLGSVQMGLNKPQSALNSFNTANKLRTFAGTQGSFDQGTGWNTIKKGVLDAGQTALTGKGLKYLTPANIGLSGLIGGGASKLSGGDFATGVGQGIGATPQIMGFVGASNPLLNKFLPKGAGNIAGRLGGAGLNIAQGLGMDIARGTPTTAGSVGLDALMGLIGGKGQFETGVKVKGMSPNVWTSDKTILNEAKQQLKVGFEIDQFSKLGKDLKNMFKQYGLASYPNWNKMSMKQQVDILDERLSEMARQWGSNVKMGITDQSKGVIPYSKKEIQSTQKLVEDIKKIPFEKRTPADNTNLFNGEQFLSKGVIPEVGGKSLIDEAKKYKSADEFIKSDIARNKYVELSKEADALFEKQKGLSNITLIEGTPRATRENKRIIKYVDKLNKKISKIDKEKFNLDETLKDIWNKSQSPSIPEVGGKETITLYHASPNMPTNGNWKEGTYLATSPESAMFYATSHHTGDVNVMPVTVPKDLVTKEGQYFRINKEYPITKLPVKTQLDLAREANQSPSIPEVKPIQQTDTVLPKGKIKTTLSETKGLVPSTKESQISQLSISKKGKLNTDKLNITPEQKTAIDTLQDNVPVTVIGNKDVIKQSKLTTGAKTAMSDAQMKTRLAQQLNSRQEVVSLTRQFEKLKQSGADELELTALKSKIINQSRIAQQEGTLAGRQLQARNILANELATPEQKIYALLDNAGIDQKKYIKDAINVDFNDATQAVNFYRKYIPPKFSEILTEIRYTNMLSSPLTQIVNTFSNVIQSGIVKPIEKTLTGGLDFISSKFTGKERQYFASQGIDYTKGYYSALPEAWNKFKNVASGKEMSLRPDLEHIPTGTKGVLKWYSAPLRVLEASDQFFRTLVQSGERKSLARLNLPESEIAKRAVQSADYTLFRQKFDPTGELGQGTVLKTWDKWNSAIQNLRKVPGGNWILPFIQTPTNILKQGVEYSPLGVSTMVGAKRPLEQLSKAIIGTTVFASLYGIADKGGTTWDVPSNAKEKELFYSAGMQPYSVKIGNKWVSYSKLGPLSYPLAMASALKWVEKNNPDQKLIGNLQDALGEMLGFFGDQSYVSSIGDFINTMKSGYGVKSAVSGEITNMVGQLIPYKSFQGWLTRMIDPTYRKPEGMVQNIQATTPGLSTGVAAYKDIYGQDSKRDLPVYNSFSPLKVSVEKPEQANLLQQQQDLNIEKAQVKKQGESLGLSDAKQSVENGGQSQTIGNSIIYYDEGVKTIDLTKYDTIAQMPSTNKYETALKESKQYSSAATLLEKQGLTPEQKTTVLKRLGIDEQTAKYYQVANDNTNLKTLYVMDKVQNSTDKTNLIEGLANLRKQVNGQMIASNAVLDNLVDEGIISKAEATQLKKYKFENGKLTSIKKTGTGTKAKKGKKIKVSIKKPPKLKSLKTKTIKIKTIASKKYKPVKFKVPKKLKVKKIAIRRSV